MVVYDLRLSQYRVVTSNGTNPYYEAFHDKMMVEMLYAECLRNGTRMWAYEPLENGGKLMEEYTIGLED